METLAGFQFEAPDPEPAPQRAAPQATPSTPSPGRDSTPRTSDVDDRLAALERENTELRGSNRQLVDLVGRQAPQPRQQEAPAVVDAGIDWGKDEDEADTITDPEDPAALVEDLSKLGMDALKKRGYVREADVRRISREESRKAAATASTQIVARARTQVTQESAIVRDFPDLANSESELFKATTAHVLAAVKLDPSAANNPATLFLAARAAQAELKGKGEPGGRRGDTRSDFDEFDDEQDPEPVMREKRTPTERDRRIAAQQGDRSRSGRSRIQSDDDGFTMTSEAKSIAKAMGISDDEYKSEATRIQRTAGASAGRRK